MQITICKPEYLRGKISLSFADSGELFSKAPDASPGFSFNIDLTPEQFEALGRAVDAMRKGGVDRVVESRAGSSSKKVA